MAVGSKHLNSEILHSAIFPEGLEVPEQIWMIQEKSQTGWVEISSGRPGRREPHLSTAQSPHLLNGGGEKERLTLRTGEVLALGLTLANHVSLGK